MTRTATPLSPQVLTVGGDQRDRDRAKAQKKAADSAKGKSTSAKEKEAYDPPRTSEKKKQANQLGI